MWEALTDTRPNEGDKILPSKTLSLTWRPHKGREIMGPGRTHQKLSNEPRYRSPFIGDLTRGTF